MRAISTLTTVLLLGACGLAVAQTPPEKPVGQAGVAAAAPAPAVSRAEVLADMEMYRRAGLELPPAYPEFEETPRYREAYAEYLRLRASPAYAAAVARYEAAGS